MTVLSDEPNTERNCLAERHSLFPCLVSQADETVFGGTFVCVAPDVHYTLIPS